MSDQSNGKTEIRVTTTRGGWEKQTLNRVIRTGLHMGRKVEYILESGRVFLVKRKQRIGAYIERNMPLRSMAEGSLLREISERRQEQRAA